MKENKRMLENIELDVTRNEIRSETALASYEGKTHS